MMRVTFIALFLATAACDAETPPVHSAPAVAPPLFRGSASEVRLRCGSEILRARLRQGQIVAQVGNESAVLVPVADPRAGSGPAFSDGKLTLYKVPDKDNWALASGAGRLAECRRETGVP